MTNPLSVEELDRGLQWTEQLEAHIDETGKYSTANVRALIDMVKSFAPAARKGIEAEAIAHGSRSPQSMGFALRDLFPTPGKAEATQDTGKVLPCTCGDDPGRNPSCPHHAWQPAASPSEERLREALKNADGAISMALQHAPKGSQLEAALVRDLEFTRAVLTGEREEDVKPRSAC